MSAPLVLAAFGLVAGTVGVHAAPANPEGVAVIIGNRNYDNAHEVRYAHRDADAFRRYVTDVLGFGEDRILDYRDLSLAGMLDVFGAPGNWDRTALWSLLDIDGGSDVVVYYSGHGMPGSDGRGYLLPVDGHPARPQLNGYAIETLEENLANQNARSFALYLDACFSGSSHAGALVDNVSGVWREQALPGPSADRMVVLTAASATETAFWDEESGHGMFTNHLLDALYGAADNDGDRTVTANEAHTYVRRKVASAVRLTHRDNQTPGLRGEGAQVIARSHGAAFPRRPTVADAAPAAQSFTVVAAPATARVRILDIAERYRPGMELPAGEYRVEVSAEGYETAAKTVRHGVEGATEHRVALGRAAPRWSAGERFRDCPGCPQMVVVPAGAFRMGCVSGQDCYDDEKPVQDVRIDRAFALSAYEVTFAEWDACVSAGGCGHRPADHGWGRGSRPVIDVSWDDAQSYVSWLSGRTGEAYRLPSEAEWEYAARAGTTTAYHWGSETGVNRANCDGCGSQWDNRQTAPVGSFAPNRFGLHDMHGNVWEWVEDCWNGSYAGAPNDGSAWLTGNCGERVLRGGSWYGKPGGLRAAVRGRFTTGVRSYGIGFRVARTLAS